MKIGGSMSTSDSDSDVIKATNSKKAKSKAAISFSEGAASQIKEWTLAILPPLLVIVRVTVIFAFALLADTLVLKIIDWSFGDIVNHNPFALTLLEGIRLLSGLGTAVAYIIYLVSSLFRDTKDALDDIRAKSSHEDV